MQAVSELDEVTFDLCDEQGEPVRRQLQRVVLSRGAWPTLLFLHEERDPSDGSWREAKVSLVRLQKKGEGYRVHATIHLAAEDARSLRDLLASWIPG